MSKKKEHRRRKNRPRNRARGTHFDMIIVDDVIMGPTDPDAVMARMQEDLEELRRSPRP